MNLFTKISALVCALAVSFSQLAALELQDQEAIQGVIQNLSDSWNSSAGEGFGKDFAVDADFVNIFGLNYLGKENIELRHREILASFLKNSVLSITSVQLREVKEGLVIALVRWSVDGFRNPFGDPSAPATTREGIFTLVFVQNDAKWEITAAQNTIVPSLK